MRSSSKFFRAFLYAQVSVLPYPVALTILSIQVASKHLYEISLWIFQYVSRCTCTKSRKILMSYESSRAWMTALADIISLRLLAFKILLKSYQCIPFSRILNRDDGVLAALLLFNCLLIAAITAITGFGACQPCIVAFTILFLAIGLLAVAALVVVSIIIERPSFELLFGFGEDVCVFIVVVASVACAVGRAHLSDGEALTVHFDAVSFFTGTSSLLLFCRRHLFLNVLSDSSLHQRHAQRVLLIILFQQLAGGLLFCLFIEAGEGEYGLWCDVLMCLYELECVVDVAYGGHVEDDCVVILGEVA